MALLVNYEGVYTAPQKLWYLIDGVWKEVTNVFESPIQQEIALIDAERINQDKTVQSISSRIDLLNSQLNGDDISVPQITDQAAIDKINEELYILQLQLEVARLEQVAITKQLFEQKAQMEYKKLVMEGELAIEKISTIVDSVNNWGVIRIDPQGPLDERLEIAIQHNLPTNERIFNYGAVYYRLYKLDQVALEDNINDLSQNFKRRLANEDYLNNTINTNYVMSLMTIQDAFNEISTFVSGGAQRILDYLWALQEQQKYILDNMENVKSNILELEELSITSDIITKDENGSILTNSTVTEQIKPLGKILLDTQGATSFLELISTEVINGITSGSIETSTYPNYDNYLSNTNAITEKVEAITSFKTTNDKFIDDIKTGVITFNSINIIAPRKDNTVYSKNLFWQSPLGNTTLSNSAGSTAIYVQGYTSSGTFKFKGNDLVTLSANHVRIINTVLSNTKTYNNGVAISVGDRLYRIVQVMDSNTILVAPEITLETNIPAIINSEVSNTKEIVVTDFVKVNDKAQPHDAIPVVMSNNSGVLPDMVDVKAYHPVINSIFYPNTMEFPTSQFTSVNSSIYDKALMVYQLNKNEVPVLESFSFNIQSVSLDRIDFVINQTEELESPMVFNIQSVSLDRIDFVINQTEELESPMVFNIQSIDKVRDTNIINQTSELLSEPFTFNIKQVTATENISNLALNGYNDIFMSSNCTIDNSLNGIEIITFDNEAYYYNILEIQEKFVNDNLANTAALDQIVITSQTGLQIEETFIDTINKENTTGPKLIVPKSVKIFDANNLAEKVNKIKNSSVIITTLNSTKVIEQVGNGDYINRIISENIIITNSNINTIDIENDFINKETTSIPSIGYQLNPGILLNT